MLSKKEYESLLKMVNKKTTVKSLLKQISTKFTLPDADVPKVEVVEATPEVQTPVPAPEPTPNFIHRPRKTAEPEDQTHERELRSGFKILTENRASKIDRMRGAPTVGQ